MSAPQMLDAPSRTALALQAFERGEFELAASELARCRADDDPDAQLRIAREMESIARTALDFGELLVRFELADRRAPVTVLGQSLLDQLEVSLPRFKKRASPQEHETAILDSAAPPEPNAPPEEIERFLAARVSPSAAFLRAPFGAGGRELRLVESNRRGYDIWWGGFFFATRHGRSPRLTLLLIRLLVRPLHAGYAMLSRWGRPFRVARAILRRLRSWTTQSDAPGGPAVLRVPGLRRRSRSANPR
jgi:hypothetical protein